MNLTNTFTPFCKQEVIRAHKIEMRPTAKQIVNFKKCSGTMRFVYNQLVAKSKMEKYSRKGFQKFCSNLRKNTPWMQEVSSRACYEAADNFHRAMENFFKSCKGQRKGRKYNKPVFKKKGSRDCFQFSSPEHFSVDGRILVLPKIEGKIWMRERIRFTGTVKAVTVKFHGGKWFAIFRVELPQGTPLSQEAARKPSVGIDFGLKSFAVLSTGETIENPHHLRCKMYLLRKRQRQVSRKINGSHRREIAKAKVSRLHRKVTDQRDAFQHLFVNSIVSRFSRVVIEDLNVAGMVKNHHLASAVSDVGWASVRVKLAYKCQDKGVELVVADRYFPSSKTCSMCGSVKAELPLNERTFHCETCGSTMDRDLNAAINLLGYQPTPPIIGSRKTRMGDLRKSLDSNRAGSFDCANTNPKLRAINHAPSEQMLVV